MRRAIGTAVLALMLTGVAISYGEPVGVLLTFEDEPLGPGAPCGGSVEVRGGKLLELRGVLFDQGDKVVEGGWECRVQQTLQQPGEARFIPFCRRPKGVALSIDGPPSAEVSVSGEIGEFGFTLAELSPDRRADLLDGKVRAQLVPAATQLTDETLEDEYPGIACLPDGSAWVAWAAFDNTADMIYAREFRDGSWGERIAVTEAAGDYFGPCLAADGEGGVWAVWSSNLDGNWELFARRRANSGWEPARRLTDRPGTDRHHRLARGPSGELYIVWEGTQDGQTEILLAQLGPEGLADERRITDDRANDWEPAIACAPDGRVFVAWDSYRNGSYDIYLREVSGGKLGEEIPVAAGPNYEAHASLAVGEDGTLWVAWDDGGPRWGMHERGNARIHAQRRLGLAYLKQGRWHRLPAGEPDLGAEFKAFCELPHLAFDGRGTLWLFFRHQTPIKLTYPQNPERRVQPRCIWNVYATRYTADGWAEPMLLWESNGRNDQRVSTSVAPDGMLWAAWPADGRRRWRAEVYVNHDVFAASLPFEASGAMAELPEAAVATPFRERPRTAPARPTVTAAGREYRLIYGDLHRHTDMSRCGMNADGSIEDTYRYAIDVVAIDFLGISDHDQDILRHRYDREQRPLQNYYWWRTEKLCDLAHREGRFAAMYGYEHGGSYKARGGHKNIFYTERGNPCFEEDAPADLFRVLDGRTAIAIPHQLADGGSATDWDQWNEKYERVAEIFQARGSYEYLNTPRMAQVRREGHYIWDAFAKGVRAGIIASSDHGLTHGAYAGVYVTDFTRQGIIEALTARRTFGATEEMVLDLRIGEHFMGEEIEVSEAPVLTARVLGTTELERVDVVKDAKFLYTRRMGQAEDEFEFTDPELLPGQSCYYYVRAVQADNEIAWSSPIWVRRTE